jgi:hypothetical protein
MEQNLLSFCQQKIGQACHRERIFWLNILLPFNLYIEISSVLFQEGEIVICCHKVSKVASESLSWSSVRRWDVRANGPLG